MARSVADRGKPTIAERAASERGEIAVPASVTRGVQEAARSAVAPLREVRNVIAPQSASPEAQRTADVVAQAKAKAANLATVEAIKYRPITKQFDRRTDAQNLAAIAAYERTGTFPDAPEGYSEFYRQSMATARTLLQNAYGDDAVGYVENYVRRAFVFGSKADEKTGTTVLTNAVRTLAANRSPTKGRVLDMPIDEALALLKGRGLSVKLETTNPERLRQWSLANARQASAFRQAWETLKDSAFVSFVPLGQRRPEGYDPISERGAQFFYPKERGLGDYYAEPNVARVLNNATSKGLGGSPTFRALRLMNGSLNQIQLGLSAFHLTGTIINAGMADVSLGLRQVFRGEAKGAARVATGLVPGASFVRDVVLGHQFLEDLKNDAPAAFDALQSRLNPGGARLQMDQRYDTQMRQQLIRAWREGRPIGAAVRLPLAAVEAIASPLMNFAIPRVKIAVALERSADVQQRMPNASPEQLARAYRATMDQIDNVFGLLVYDNGFWNKTAQDLSQLATRSVGWTGGTLRWGVGAMADVGQLLRGGGGGRKPPPGAAGAPAGAEPPPFDGRVPGVSDRLLDALILPIYVGLIGAVYMYLHTKKRPQSAKDYYYPLNGRLDSNGHPSRTSLPTYMKDVYAYGTDPFGTLLRKQSPLFDEGTALWGNEDYWHVMIRDPRDPMARQLADVGRYLARENLPFSLQQATVPTVGGVSAEQKAEAVLGFTKASVRVTETPAEAYLHRIAPPSHLTHDEAARATARRDVRGLLQAGQPAEAMAAARAAGLSPASVRDTVRSAREGGLVSAFKRTTWNDAVHTYELATPEERQKLRTPFLQKVGRALAGAPATERAAILAQRTAALQLPTQ